MLREHGLSVASLASQGGMQPPFRPVYNIFDSALGELPALVGLIVGDAARACSNASEQSVRAAVLHHFAEMFDNSMALQPLHYICKDWIKEPFSEGTISLSFTVTIMASYWLVPYFLCSGCYASLIPPNVLTRCGHALREPVANAIFWCSTERALRWPGYLEGSVDSGYRAAEQVLASMPLGVGPVGSPGLQSKL